MYTSKVSLSPRDSGSGKMVRPLSRKDIFYSGSVTNLREYQSQKSLTNYRNSVISLTKYEKDARDGDIEKGERESSVVWNEFVKFNIFVCTLQNTICVHASYFPNHSNQPLAPCWTLAC